jgi:hypothetical protein
MTIVDNTVEDVNQVHLPIYCKNVVSSKGTLVEIEQFSRTVHVGV